jgi:hypothetical protein
MFFGFNGHGEAGLTFASAPGRKQLVTGRCVRATATKEVAEMSTHPASSTVIVKNTDNNASQKLRQETPGHCQLKFKHAVSQRLFNGNESYRS